MEDQKLPEQVITFKGLFSHREISDDQDIEIKCNEKLSLLKLINSAEPIKTNSLPIELLSISLSDELYLLAVFWSDSDSETRIAFNPIEGNLISYSIDTGIIYFSRADPVDLAYFILDRFDNHMIINILFQNLVDRKYTITEEYELIPC